MTDIQQGTILGRLGFRGFVLEEHLILQSLCQFSNSFGFGLGLKIFRYGMVVTSKFSIPMVSSWGFSGLNSTTFFSRVKRGEVTSARFGMTFPKYVIMPRNRWSSFRELQFLLG